MPESSIKWNVSGTNYTLLFMVILSFICALILSILASALQVPQEVAKELDRSTQMLIAARIITHEGYFQVKEKDKYVPAEFTDGGVLVPSEKKIIATKDQILDVYRLRIQSFLVNDQGETTTFEKAGIDEQKYLTDFKKTGYYKEPWKLIYKIFQNEKRPEAKPLYGYVIPINGMGLWDAIYGYIALEPNGINVIGISWYDQKETPGLGANISEESWQKQFHDKMIFQPSPDGKVDEKTAPIGITVVKGKVSEVLGDSPKAKTAVDGMAGATLTGNGVTDAYRNDLSAYRPFLIKISEEKNGK